MTVKPRSAAISGADHKAHPFSAPLTPHLSQFLSVTLLADAPWRRVAESQTLNWSPPWQSALAPPAY